MGIEGIGFDGLEGVSPSFAEALYQRYRAAAPAADDVAADPAADRLVQVYVHAFPLEEAGR